MHISSTFGSDVELSPFHVLDKILYTRTSTCEMSLRLAKLQALVK